MGRLEFAACLGLFVTGVYSTSFGPAMSVLADDFGVSLDRAGLLITVLFLGSILASATMALRLHRFDPRWLAAGGLALVAAGSVGVALVEGWGLALASVAVIGAGDGFMVAAVHTIVARVSRDVAHGINRLNVCFAIGAIVGPLWSAGVLASDAGARESVYLAIGGLAGVVAVVVATAPGLPAVAASAAGEGRAAGMTPLAWVMGFVLFLYVGAEFGLGSWVASYADEEFEAGILAGGFITAGYWGALMLGRLLSGALFSRGVPARRVLAGSIAGGMVTSAAIAFANEQFAVAVAAAFVTGLAFGPIWPAAMAIASEGRSSSAPAAMVTIGNSGGFVFPWLQGRLLVSAGATTGIAMSAALCALMLVLAWWALRMGRRSEAAGYLS